MQHQRTVFIVTDIKTRNKIKFNKPRNFFFYSTQKKQANLNQKGKFFFMKTLLVTELPKHIVYNESAKTLTPKRHASKNINNIVHSQHITLKS